MSNDVKIFGGMILATIILIVGAVFFLGRGNDSTPQSAQAKPTIVPKATLVKDDSWKIGSDSAKVTLVEFGDYQCPTCKAYEPIIQDLRKKYGDKVLVVYRHFPIVQAHPFAMSSATAAEAAGAQGKFWEFHEQLFALSPKLDMESLIKAAEKIDLDMPKFKAEMDSDAGRQRVLNDLTEGTKIGVQGTPTFYINGKNYSLAELPNLKAFESKIDPLLK